MLAQIKSIFKQKKTYPTKGMHILSRHDWHVSDTGPLDLTAEEKQKNKDVATRIVQEEKQRKTVLPQYPGLERFEMIEKIGE